MKLKFTTDPSIPVKEALSEEVRRIGRQHFFRNAFKPARKRKEMKTVSHEAPADEHRGMVNKIRWEDKRRKTNGLFQTIEEKGGE